MPVYHRDCEVDCCELPPVGCERCVDGLAPAIVTVAISGIVNDSCNECSGFNNVWELEFLGAGGGECIWGVEAESCFGSVGVVNITATLSVVFGNTLLQVQIAPLNTSWMTWTLNLGPTLAECMEWSGLSIPFDNVNGSMTGICDPSSSAVSITSGAL